VRLDLSEDRAVDSAVRIGATGVPLAGLKLGDPAIRESQ
jgi:hypothetical protein